MKGVLVIDMPSDCYHCPLHDYEYRWCYGKNESSVLREEDIESKRTEGCPLKPMPTKITTATLSEREQEETELFTSMAMLKTYADGWNDCLKEIEK